MQPISILKLFLLYTGKWQESLDKKSRQIAINFFMLADYLNQFNQGAANSWSLLQSAR